MSQDAGQEVRADCPNVYQYRDAVRFLSDCFQHRKLKERGEFSVRQWAREMEMESPEVLMTILRRKRPLKLKHLGFIERGLDLGTEEKTFLKVLIQLAHARDAEERALLEILLGTLLPKQSAPIRIVEGADELFSHWSRMAIFELCKLESFEATEDSLCSALGERMGTEEVLRSLEVVMAHGLVERDPCGRLRARVPRVGSRNDASVESVRRYYEQVTDLARKAAQLPPREREFQCFAMSFDENDLPLAKELLRTFRSQLARLSSPGGRAVYQANLQFFPMVRVAVDGESGGPSATDGRRQPAQAAL